MLKPIDLFIPDVTTTHYLQKVFDKGYYNENETEKPTFEDDPGLELESKSFLSVFF